MTSTKSIFTAADIGCWIDGAFGQDHYYGRMIDLLVAVPGVKAEEAIKDCEKTLAAMGRADDSRAKPGDDDLLDCGSELLDDCTDLLQEHTEEGLYWVWHDGDLVLTDETEEG